MKACLAWKIPITLRTTLDTCIASFSLSAARAFRRNRIPTLPLAGWKVATKNVAWVFPSVSGRQVLCLRHTYLRAKLRSQNWQVKSFLGTSNRFVKHRPSNIVAVYAYALLHVVASDCSSNIPGGTGRIYNSGGTPALSGFC